MRAASSRTERLKARYSPRFPGSASAIRRRVVVLPLPATATTLRSCPER